MVVVFLTAFKKWIVFLDLSVPTCCYGTFIMLRLALYMFGMIIDLSLNLMQLINLNFKILKQFKLFIVIYPIIFLHIDGDLKRTVHDN